jgi:ribonuclease HII
MILGIDEVGRGPWAGPLVVGAVVLGGTPIDGLTDSKKLSKKRRDELDILIRERASGFGLGWVHADELDEVGLSAALVLATKRAVEQVTVPYHEIIIDGTINFLAETSKGQYVTTMPKADLLVPSVSAASIIAKVARDTYMEQQDELYPVYKFKSHVGYGTAAHRAAIDAHGVTPLHRLSFAPLQKYAKLKVKLADPPKVSSIATTTKTTGDVAEDAAAQYLVHQGHEVLERNWKTKYCEIDIVSHKNGTIYFAEVKYRKKLDQGGGIAAITPKKLNQMKFAAKLYAQSKQINDTNLLLVVMSMTGNPPEVEEYIELT